MRRRAIAEVVDPARDLDKEVVLVEVRAQPGFGAPLRRRQRAGRWRQVFTQRFEHLADEALRCPVGEADPASRPTDPRQFRGSLGLVRRKHHAKGRKHRVKTGVFKGQCFGIRHLKDDIAIQALCPDPVLTAFKQCGDIVRRADDAASTRRRQRGVTVAGRHVEHSLIAQQVTGFGQLFADDLQGGADHGVVATGPGSHLTVFQGNKINGCTHEFRSVAVWNATRLIPPWWDR